MAVGPGASWPFVILSEAKDLKARLEILRSLRFLRMTVDWYRHTALKDTPNKPAVYLQRGARNVAGVLGCEERHRCGELARFADARKRDVS